MTRSYCLFDTAMGVCGIAWREGRLTRVQLPESDVAKAEGRLRRFTGATEPPDAIVAIVDALRRTFDGEAVDFAFVAVDYGGLGDFEISVCEAARKIGRGTALTYGELARRVGSPDAARAVGQTMGRNPVPIVVPCHRGLAAGGKPGGFSAYGGTLTKARLLRLEGFAPAADAGQLTLEL